MAIKHNQQLVNNHFRKDWQRRVRTHFDQPGKKSTRRELRRTKAATLAPRPVDALRPIVRCPTVKYNRRVRAGRGFTLEELKAAGLHRLWARTHGIAVDGRRRNLSEESLAANVARLKEYTSRLIVFPRKSSKPKKGEVKIGTLGDAKVVKSLSAEIPIVGTDKTIREIKKSDMPAPVEGGAYRALRVARSEARYAGAREKRARDLAEAEANKK